MTMYTNISDEKATRRFIVGDVNPESEPYWGNFLGNIFFVIDYTKILIFKLNNYVDLSVESFIF